MNSVGRHTLMLALVAGAAVLLPIASASEAEPPDDEPRTIRAAFAERSYAPGERAVLTVRSPVSRVSLRV